MSRLIDFILHMDRHIDKLVAQYGAWTYAILFAVIFAETGLIVVPFLPGDSLLFVLGIFSGPQHHSLDVGILFVLLSSAAILGDQLNYQIGKFFGSRLFRNPNSRLFKPSHLEITQEFYAKHGSKTVLLARFVPVVRALAPFVAGMSGMKYRTFCSWSISGALLWVAVCVFGGYVFGQIPAVKDHFELGILVIVLFSVVPAIIEFFRHRSKKKSKARASEPANESA